VLVSEAGNAASHHLDFVLLADQVDHLDGEYVGLGGADGVKVFDYGAEMLGCV